MPDVDYSPVKTNVQTLSQSEECPCSKCGRLRPPAAMRYQIDIKVADGNRSAFVDTICPACNDKPSHTMTHKELRAMTRRLS